MLDVNKYPVFTNEDKFFISRDKFYVRTLEKMKKLIQYKKQYDLSRYDWIYLLSEAGEASPIFLVTKGFFLFVWRDTQWN